MLLLLAFACAPEAPPPLCPAYSGFTEVGRSWTWRSFADDAETTATLTDLDADVVTLVGDGWQERYRCDPDGLWAVARTEDDDGGGPDGWSARWDYDPAALVMPATFAVGDAWTTAWAWHYSDSAGTVETASRTEQVDVVGEGESNVRAGAFTTLELHRLDDDAAARTEYRAADVGLVLDDDAQLLSLQPD